MARIPQEEIDRIKHEVPLADIVRARGVELKVHGANLLGLCPFHEDHDPSLVITPAKNLWHCLGACQIGGDVFAWVQKTEGVSFRHAYELLSTRFFVASPSDGLVLKKRSDVPKLGSPFTLEMHDDELRLAYIDYCHEELKRSPEAARYLEKRGLTSSELITQFRLGFSNRTLGLRLPAMSRKEGQAIRSRLQALGILRSSGHEHFNGCLLVPVFDDEGCVSEIYGRKITPRLTPGLAHHLYLPGPHRGVWNAEALAQAKEIILCEALIDDVLVRRLSERDGELRGRGVHRGSSCSVETARNGARADRVRPGRGGGRGSGKAGAATDGGGDERRADRVPERDGCKRVRVQSHAGGEVARGCGALGGVDGERGGRRTGASD